MPAMTAYLYREGSPFRSASEGLCAGRIDLRESPKQREPHSSHYRDLRVKH
jgi:hypothetical protein